MAWYDRFQRKPKRRKVPHIRKYQGANTGRLFADFLQTSTSADEEIKNNLRLYNNFRSDGTYNIIINGVSINVPGTGTDSTAYRWTIVDLTSADTTGSSVAL